LSLNWIRVERVVREDFDSRVLGYGGGRDVL
jgi:hypothetical protein